jgi:Flp pilus assembly protein TadD
MRMRETKLNSAPADASASSLAHLHVPAWLLAMLLALVTIALYWPALHCDFINLDDDDNVTNNFHVQGGLNWEGIKWAFTNTQQAAYWAPMLWLSHMLTCQFFGLNPWGHHLINVLLHALNTALVFLLFRRLTGATWRSFFVAALFGWHPLRVESVAWLTERKDVLSAFFGLLSLICYVRFVEQKGARSQQQGISDSLILVPYCWSLFFFALGLMSKPMLVTWPFVMLLLDWWPLKRFAIGDLRLAISRLVVEKLPFFVLAVAASAVTFLVQKRGGAVMSMATLPFGVRLENALISYCRYLGKLFWPVDLAVFYPHPGHWPMGLVLLAGILLASITALCLLKRTCQPFLLMGWLWFAGTLVPVIGLVQAGSVAMADRFTYIPALGMLILVIWGVHELTCCWRNQALVSSVAGGVAIVLCLGLTHRQLGYWQDTEILFRHALAVAEDNYFARVELGAALDQKGRIDEAISQFRQAVRLNPNDDIANNNLGNDLLRQGQIDEAIGRFEQAVRLDPRLAGFHYNLGRAFSLKGQTDEAINQYQETIRLKPDYAEAHYRLGIALNKEGRLDEAMNEFQEAIRLKPDFPEAYYNLGTVLGVKGRIDEAINQFREAIRLKPDYAEAYNNLGSALKLKGQSAEAIHQFQEAIRWDPDDASAYYNLGSALAEQGQIDEAIRQYQQAIRRQPDDPKVHYNLGNACNRVGRTDEAILQYQEALRLNPEMVEARYNLGVTLCQKGRLEEAIGQFQEVIRLRPDFAEARQNLEHALELKNASTNR